MIASPVDGDWGSRVLRVMRLVAACSLAVALAEYGALKVLERQNSCLAYIELTPLLTLSIGITIAGATAVLAAFAGHFEKYIGLRLQHIYRVVLLALVPAGLGIFYLFTEYAPLVRSYISDPAVFCD